MCQHLLDQISVILILLICIHSETPTSALQVERVSYEFEDSVAECFDFFLTKHQKLAQITV